MNKHENYDILNLLGYGLAKFDNAFIHEFGFTTKNAFFNYFVEIGIAQTASVVKNRMDLFDPFFDNPRRGWWQKGDLYIHRKHLIDSLFGNENVAEYANIIKLILKDQYKIKELSLKSNPITNSKYKKMQETGLEAELYFLHNYNEIEIFKGGKLEDARLYGDGYDFQISINTNFYLAEIKGLRGEKGGFRLSQNEYEKAREYKNDYILTLVLNLDKNPRFFVIDNPLKNLPFKETIRTLAPTKEYIFNFKG